MSPVSRGWRQEAGRQGADITLSQDLMEAKMEDITNRALYQEEFNTSRYVEQYYSKVDREEAFFLDKLHHLFHTTLPSGCSRCKM